MYEMNEWKKIWQNRRSENALILSGDKKTVFLELKRSNGFDVMKDKISYEALYEQFYHIRELLSYNPVNSESFALESVYEVGCGSGANLYLLENEGTCCGGIDFSEELLQGAKRILQSDDLSCDEAIALPVSLKYDAVFSNSVLSYFRDENYTWNVLERMYKKTKFSIGLIDIHDIEKKDDYISFRKKEIEDYEDRYKNLPKLFFSKTFFQKFAKEHNMDIYFDDYQMDGYWNNEFVFHCYLYKRG